MQAKESDALKVELQPLLTQRAELAALYKEDGDNAAMLDGETAAAMKEAKALKAEMHLRASELAEVGRAQVIGFEGHCAV